jgi:hypothetical protein
LKPTNHFDNQINLYYVQILSTSVD